MNGCRATAIALALGSSSACSQCDRGPGESPPAPTLSVDVSHARLAPAFAWREHPSSAAFGAPEHCKLRSPPRVAPLPAGTVRFFAPRDRGGDLAIASAKDGSGVTTRGLVPTGGGPVRDLPWEVLDHPPPSDRADSGWVALLERPRAPMVDAILWREHGEPELALTGDQLEAREVMCVKDRCAALTTLASPAFAPGATVLWGTPTEPVATWNRVDVSPDPERPWSPSSIVAVGEARVDVALSADGELALWRVEKTGAHELGRVPAAHGVLDIGSTEPPLVVTAGRSQEGCGDDRFPIDVRRIGKETHSFETSAPPDTLVVRPLPGGALLVWVSPVSCRMRDRMVVSAAVADADGRVEAPMAVADARGFAVTVEGAKVDLWLAREREIAWVALSCGGAD